MTQRMTQTPDPATAGDKVRICYDTSGCTLPITLSGVFAPGNQTFEYQITSDAGNCFDVIVPNGAQGGDVVDSTGQSEDFAIAVA